MCKGKNKPPIKQSGLQLKIFAKSYFKLPSLHIQPDLTTNTTIPYNVSFKLRLTSSE